MNLTYRETEMFRKVRDKKIMASLFICSTSQRLALVNQKLLANMALPSCKYYPTATLFTTF